MDYTRRSKSKRRQQLRKNLRRVQFENLESRQLLAADAVQFEDILSDSQFTNQRIQRGLEQVFNDMQRSLETAHQGVLLPLIGEQLIDAPYPVFNTLDSAAERFSSTIESVFDRSEPTDELMDLYQKAWFEVFGANGADILKNDSDELLPASIDDVVTTTSNNHLQWNFTLGGDIALEVPFDLGVDFSALEFANEQEDLFANFGLNVPGDASVEFTFSWELNLGFGITESEGEYEIYVADMGSPEFEITGSAVLSDDFSAATGTGTLQAVATNGTTPELRLIADTSILTSQAELKSLGNFKFKAFKGDPANNNFDKFDFDLSNADVSDNNILSEVRNLLKELNSEIITSKKNTAGIDAANVVPFSVSITPDGKLVINSRSNKYSKIEFTGDGSYGFGGNQQTSIHGLPDELTRMRFSTQLDITEGDGRLTLDDVSPVITVDYVPTIDFDSDVRLSINSGLSDLVNTAAGYSEQGLGLADGSLRMPEVNYELKLDPSGTIYYVAGKQVPFALKPTPIFDNVELDLGPLVESIVKPVAGVFEKTLGPVFDVVGKTANAANGFLDERLPVISDLRGKKTTLSDLLPGTTAFEDYFDGIEALSKVGSGISYDGGPLQFGGWFFQSKLKLILPEEVSLFAGDLAAFAQTFQLSDVEDATSFLSTAASDLVDQIQEELQPFQTGDFLNFSDLGDFGGFNLDIADVDSMLNMLAGQPFEIVSLDLPSVQWKDNDAIGFGFDLEALEFDIAVGGEVNLGGKDSGDALGVVYDSTGIQNIVNAFSAGGTPDYSDLLDGFYLRNQKNEEEILLKIRAEGSGSVDVGIMSAEGTVQGSTSIALDIKDPNNDGQLRLDEIFDLTDGFSRAGDLLGLFDITVDGKLSADISGKLFGEEINAKDLGFDPSIEFRLSKSDFFGNRSAPNVPSDEILATIIDDAGERVLRLNVGPYANHRLYDTTQRNDIGGFVVSASDSGDDLKIELKTNVNATPYATQTIVDIADKVDRILVVGLDGDDNIDLSGVGLPVDVIGNGGNDVIKTGSGDDLIKGGDGIDLIYGGAGSDVIFAGRGGDTVYGDLGPGSDVGDGIHDDYIDGEQGDDALNGEFGRDQILGGSGNDDLHVDLDDFLADGDQGDGDVLWAESLSTTIATPVVLANGELSHGLKVVLFDNLERIEFGFGRELQDSLRIQGVPAPVHIASGLEFLSVDRTDSSESESWRVTGSQLTSSFLPSISFPNDLPVALNLGAAGDHVTIDSWPSQFDLDTGDGDDRVEINRDTNESSTINTGEGFDQVAITMESNASFVSIGFNSVEELVLDHLSTGSKTWTYDAGLVSIGTGNGKKNIVDANGVQRVLVAGSGADDLIVDSETTNPQLISISDDRVEIQEGLQVLGPAVSVTTGTALTPVTFGALTFDVLVQGLDDPASVVASPDGQHVYVASRESDAVTVFRRNAGDGTLEFVQFVQDGQYSVDGLDDASAIAISSDGKFVYVGNRDDAKQLSVFERRSTGRLVYRQAITLEDENGIDFSRVVALEHSNRGYLYGIATIDGESAVFATPVQDDGLIGSGTSETFMVADSVFLAIAYSSENNNLYAVREADSGKVDTFELNFDGRLPNAKSSQNAANARDIAAVEGNVYVAKADGIAQYSWSNGSLNFEELIQGSADAVAIHASNGMVVAAFDEGTRNYVPKESSDSDTFNYRVYLDKVKIINAQDEGNDEVRVTVNGQEIKYKTGKGNGTQFSIDKDYSLDNNNRRVKVIEVDSGNSNETLIERNIERQDYTKNSDGTQEFKVNKSGTINGRKWEYELHYSIERTRNQKLDPDYADVKFYYREPSGDLVLVKGENSSGDERLGFSGTKVEVLDDIEIVDNTYYGVDQHDRDVADETKHNDRITSLTLATNANGGVNDFVTSDAYDLEGKSVVTQAATLQAGSIKTYVLPSAKSAYTINPANAGLIVSKLNNDDEISDPIRQFIQLDGITSESQIAFNSTEDLVFVSRPDTHSVTVFSRTISGANLGVLTELSTYSDGVDSVDGLYDAAAIAVSPDDAYLYVAGRGQDVGDIARFTIASDGALSYVGRNLNKGREVSSLRFTAGNRLLAAGSGDSTLTSMSQSNTGGLIIQQTLANSVDGVHGIGNPIDVEVSSDGTTVYVAGAEDDSIAVFSVDDSGDLTFLQRLREGVDGTRGLAGLKDLKLSNDDQYLFAIGDDQSTLVVFYRDAETGLLTYVQRLRNTSAGVTEMVSPTRISTRDGMVFVSSEGEAGFGAIAQFDIADLANATPNQYAFDYSGVDAIEINSGTGDDEITLREAAIAIEVNSKAGDDLVFLEQSGSHRSTTINLGSGADKIDLLHVADGSSVTVSGGADFDEINLFKVEPHATVTLNGNSDQDTFYLAGDDLNSAVTIDGGSQNDTLKFSGESVTPASPSTPDGTLQSGVHSAAVYSRIENIGVVAAPTASVHVPGESIREGDSLLLDGRGSQIPPGSEVALYEWDLNNDGVFGEVVGERQELSWQTLEQFGIIDDGQYPIRLKVTSDFGSDIAETTLTVVNQQPTVTLQGDSSVDQYVPYLLELSSSDFGDDTISEYRIDWGDNTSEVVDGTTTELSHAFEQSSANITIKVTAIDLDGETIVEKSISVQSAAQPTYTISGDASVNEDKNYNVSLTDVLPEGYPASIDTWQIDWGDGTVDTKQSGSRNATHKYPDDSGDSRFPISVLITDTRGAQFFADNELFVEVINVAPQLSFIPSTDQTINEGESVTLSSLSAKDGGDDIVTRWEIDWGDGLIETVTGTPDSLSHTYRDDGNYEIRVAAIDEDGIHFDQSEFIDVTVANVAPELTLDVPTQIDEGSEFTLDVTSFDPGDDTIGQWSIDWGDGTVEIIEDGRTQFSHVYLDDIAGTTTILVSATDEDAQHAAASVGITVNDVAPVVSVEGSTNAYEGVPYTLDFSAFDPGVNDTFNEWTITWGDGTTDIVAAEIQQLTHTYTIEGSYEIKAKAQQGSSSKLMVEVFDQPPVVDLVGLDVTPRRRNYDLALSVPTDTANSSNDRFTHYRVYWGDETLTSDGEFDPTQYEEYAIGSEPLTLSHYYPNKGVYGIGVQLVAEDGSLVSGGARLIEVEENRRPSASIPTIPIVAGETTSYAVNANDAENDVLTYSLVDGPEGLAIDAATGVITWTPTEVQSQSSSTATIRIQDSLDDSEGVVYPIQMQPMDFGDALLAGSPIGATLLENDGARHGIVEGFHLGGGVDADLDGVSSALANGDDIRGIDDEDGIHFPTALIYSSDETVQTTIEVTLSSPYGFGQLYGWIDLDQNGRFTAREFLVNEFLVDGVNEINIAIPSFGVTLGETMARFRLTSDFLSWTDSSGYVFDGEVEDYLVQITENTAPVSYDDSITVSEDDGSVTFNVLADNGFGEDDDAENNLLPNRTVNLTSPSNGVLTNHGDGAFTYDLASAFESLAVNETQSFSFAYQIEDAFGETSVSTVSIEVQGSNDAPTVGDAIRSTANEDDAPYSIDLLAGASDVDASDVLSVDAVQFSGDVSGVSLNGNSLNIDPSAYNALAVGESAVIEVTYNVIDGNSGSVAQTATITIEGANDGPTLAGPVDSTATEDAVAYSIDLLAGAGDVDVTDVLSVDAVQFIGDVSGVSFSGNSLDIDPSAYSALAVGESAVIEVTYNVIDGNSGSIRQSATITIEGANDGPAVGDPIVSSANEDDAGYSIDLLAGASDVDASDVLSVDAVQFRGNVDGVSLNGNSLQIDPQAYNDLLLGSSEVIVVDYNVIDGNSGSVSQSATITIEGANDGPTIESVSLHGVIDSTDRDGNARFRSALLNEGESIVPGQLLELRVEVAGLADSSGVNVQVDWGDGVTEQFGGSDLRIADNESLALRHRYDGEGSFTVQLTVSNPEGSDQIFTTVQASRVSLQSSVLFLAGTEGQDHIRLDTKDQTTLRATLRQRGGQSTIVEYPIEGLSEIVVLGRAGKDFIHVGHGISLPTILDGGADSDLIFGGKGADKIVGGLGSDKLLGRAGNDMIHGNQGDDRIWGNRGDDFILGGEGHDKVSGGRGMDEIWGGDGDDLIWGRDAIDIIHGGEGSDILIGGDGDDQLFGDNGDDWLDGGSGNDRMVGGEGSDVLLGGRGNDMLLGEDGNDLLFGGSGDDVLDGGNGDDLLIGGPGNDALDGGDGLDLLVDGWRWIWC